MTDLRQAAEMVLEALAKEADLYEAEMEACAELCEWARPTKQDFDERYWHGCTDCANAIRSRGE